MKCLHCEEVFSHHWNYYDHVRTAHPEYVQANWYSCQFCLEYYPKIEILKRHWQACPKNALKNPPNISSNLEALQVIPDCGICSRGHGSNQHMRSFHKEYVEKFWVKCGICLRYYPDFNVLQEHLKTCPISPVKIPNENKVTYFKKFWQKLHSILQSFRTKSL